MSSSAVTPASEGAPTIRNPALVNTVSPLFPNLPPSSGSSLNPPESAAAPAATTQVAMANEASVEPQDVNVPAMSSTALGKRKATAEVDEVVSDSAAGVEEDKEEDDVRGVSDPDRMRLRPSKKRKITAEPEPLLDPTSTLANGNITNGNTTKNSTTKTDPIRIGTVKKGNDAMIVRAEMYKNGTVNYRVHRDDVPDDVAARHSEFMMSKRQVQLEEVIYDQALFPQAGGYKDIQVSTEQQKRSRVRGFLSNLHQKSRPNNPEASSATGSTLPTPGLPSTSNDKNSATSSTRATRGTAKSTTTSADEVINEFPGLGKKAELVTKKASTSQESSHVGVSTRSTRAGSRSGSVAPKTSVNEATSAKPKKMAKQIEPILEKSSEKEAESKAKNPTRKSKASGSKSPTKQSKPKTKTNNNASSKDMIVGKYKPMPHLNVYAYVRTYGVPPKDPNDRTTPFTQGLAPCYRLHPEDGSYEETIGSRYWPTLGMPAHEDILYARQFQREDETATRAVVRAVLLQRRRARREYTRANNIESDVDSIIDIDSDEADHLEALKQYQHTPPMHARDRNKGSYWAAKPAAPAFEEESDGYETPLEGAFPPVTKPAESEKDSQIRIMRRQLNEAQAEVARQASYIIDLEAAARKNPIPTTIMATQCIKGTEYEIMGSGHNSGSLITKDWTEVRIRGKKYKEWIVLREFKLDMGNIKPISEGEAMKDGVFKLIPDGKNKGKLVSNYDTYEPGSRKFAKWLVREEIVEGDGMIL